MPFPARLLGEGEEVVLELNPHWSMLSAPALCLGATVGVTIGVTVAFPKAPIAVLYVFFVAIGACLLWLITRWTRRATTTITVTNARVVKRAGVLSRTNLEIRLERINELSCHQSIGGRLLGMGEVLIEVGGESGVIVFDHVPRPSLVQSIISEQVSRWHRGSSAPVAHVEMPAVDTPPAGIPFRTSGTDGATSAAERLVQLDELRRRGIVSAEEYANKKQELLREL